MAGKPADKKLTIRPGNNEAVVGSAADYAAYYNFGTRRQSASAFLSAAGLTVAAKMKGQITADQEQAIKKEVASSFDRQIAEGVEIIRYGNPVKAIEKATVKSIKEACIDIAAAAKSNINNDTGYLRNSVMWRTEKEEDGFNVW